MSSSVADGLPHKASTSTHAAFVLKLLMGLSVVGVAGEAAWLITSPHRGGVVARPQCGHWAVFNVSQLLGVPISMNEAMATLPARKKGHSFAQLRDALNTIGIDAVGHHETFEELLEGSFPAVVHLAEPDHFVVAIKAQSPSLLFFDAAGNRARLRTSEIQKRFTGNVLRVTRNGSSEASLTGPAMHIDCLYLDQGNIPPGTETVMFAYPFRNVGDAPLSIEEVSVSCSCLSSQAPEQPIAPGAEGVIQLEYAVSDSSPQFIQTAAVKTNDPRHPVIALRAAGNQDQSLSVAPGIAAFGHVVAGREESRLVLVRYFGDDEFQIERIHSSDPQVSATLVVPSADEVKRQWPGLDSPGGAKSDNVFLRVAIAPEHNILTQRQLVADLSLDTNLASAPLLRVPVRATIIPQVRVAPSLIRLPAEPASSTTVFLVHSDGKPIEMIHSNAAALGMQLQSEQAPKSGTLRISMRPSEEPIDLRQRPQHLELNVREVGSEALITVPVEIIGALP